MPLWFTSPGSLDLPVIEREEQQLLFALDAVERDVVVAVRGLDADPLTRRERVNLGEQLLRAPFGFLPLPVLFDDERLSDLEKWQREDKLGEPESTYRIVSTAQDGQVHEAVARFRRGRGRSSCRRRRRILLGRSSLRCRYGSTSRCLRRGHSLCGRLRRRRRHRRSRLARLGLFEDTDRLAFVLGVGDGRVEKDARSFLQGAGDVERFRALALGALD